MSIHKNRFLKIGVICIITGLLIFPFHIFNWIILNRPVAALAGEADLPPVIDFIPITRVEAGKPIEIIVNIESENTVMSPRLYYRKKGELRYNMIRMKRKKDTFTATIPKSAVTGDGVEYYITASDMYDNYVSEGDAEKPLFASVIGEIDEEPPTIDFKPVREIEMGKDILLKAKIDDKSEIKDVYIYYRKKNSPSYNIIQMDRTDKSDNYYMAAIPAKEALDKDIEYYIEAADIFDNIASEGTEDYPFIAKAAKQRKVGAPWYKKWWVWAIATGIVVGGASAISASDPGGGGESTSDSPTIGRITIE